MSGGPLAPQELENAEKYRIKESQKALNDRLKRGDLKSLSPFTDDSGIIRVGGQVNKVFVSFEIKHPAVLPQTIGYLF